MKLFNSLIFDMEPLTIRLELGFMLNLVEFISNLKNLFAAETQEEKNI